MNNQNLNYQEIQKLRKQLTKKLSEYQGSKYLKLDIEISILEQIIFMQENNQDEFSGKIFAIPMDLLRKIDFTGISFEQFRAFYEDFSNTKGICINPQKVYDKNLCGSVLDSVEITGPFDNCDISGTNFTGSHGAIINPKLVKGWNLCYTTLTDATIIGSLDGCLKIGTNIYGATFQEDNQIIDTSYLLTSGKKKVKSINYDYL